MADFFCYGTLKKGFSAHRILKNAPAAFLGEVITNEDYHLYDVGNFPGMVFDSTTKGGVKGELYKIPERAFNDLDRYECVNTGLFRREEIILQDGSKAYTYIFNSNLDNAIKIEDGLWK